MVSVNTFSAVSPHMLGGARLMILLSIDAHQDANSSSSDELHLVSCKDVAFEVRDGAPGVKFKKNDEEGWTPVKKRRRKKDKVVNDSGSELDADIDNAREVRYEETEEDGPCLYVRRGCTNRNVKRISIRPSPIATRSRARHKIV